MRRQMGHLVAAAVLTAGASGCSSHHVSQAQTDENTGDVDLALTNAPSDVSCLRVTVSGIRTDVRSFPLGMNQQASFSLKGLPVGTASIMAEAFEVSCPNLIPGVDPTWYSDPQVIKISAHEQLHVALTMIHNGRVSLGVDFDEKRGPKQPPQPGLSGGTFSSEKRAYLVPTQPGVVIKPILTAGDSPNLKPDGMTPYRMAGIPDGLGAYDNGDGTFTLLSNHEISSATTAIRAHGGRGAFVSRWVVRKTDFAVMHGEDLMQQVITWNPMSSMYNPPASGASGITFLRFCSADLPAPSALFDVGTGLGYSGRIFFDGEEVGSEGRGVAHLLDGTSYELPRLGKMSFENSVANAGTGVETVVAGMDDSTPGFVYFYYGNKTNAGSPVDKAGLTNGVLYGVKVAGIPVEDAAAGITSVTPFELFPFGNVENTTGTVLRATAGTNLVTKFNRPEDGAWDPNSPNDYYWVTTASFTTSSRLWRLHFNDVTQPALGGTIEMLLDGTEGHKMFDNMTLDYRGHVYLNEDVGGNDRLGKVYRYDIATDTLTEIAHSNPIFFDPTIASPEFLTNDEEATGIIDAEDLLGPGWLLVALQNHKGNPDPELFEGGQYMAIFDPGGK